MPEEANGVNDISLRRCPFCGCLAWIHESETYYVRCACGAMGPSSATAEGAARKWNTRWIRESDAP